MAFGTLGMGFLPTDPRKKKNPTGGSIKAGQPKDTSSVITGNPADTGLGFASPAATGGMFAKPYVAPPPSKDAMAKTASEDTELKESRGVATTHENMGSLSVDFRASEKAKADAGEQTTTQIRDAKVLDLRAANEHKRTVLDPAAREASKFRAQAAAAKNMFGDRTYSSNLGKSSAGVQGSSRSNTKLTNAKKSASGSRSASVKKKTSIAGPDHSWLIAGMGKAFSEYEENPDILAMDATRAHSQAPSALDKSWQSQASAQSASGKASPAAMAQAAFSQSRRQNPNK